MLRDHIQRHQQLTQLVGVIAAMPDYPIYHDAHGGYVIYIAGRRCWFASETVARQGQLMARARWLRQRDAVPPGPGY